MFELHTERELGPLDQMFKPFFWCYLLCFPVEDEQKQLVEETIGEGLRKLRDEHRNLAGSMQRLDYSPTGRGQMHFVKPEIDRQIPMTFVYIDSSEKGRDTTYRDLASRDFPMKSLDSDILAPLTSGRATTKHVMAVQANFLAGGLILAFCFHHNFVDGSGAAQIIARFSEHCNGTAVLSRDGVNIPATLSYPINQSKHRFDELKDDDRLWRLNCLEKPSSGQNDAPNRWPEVIPVLPPVRDEAVVSQMFCISEEAMIQIKREAKPPKESAWVSTNDALVAFLWRHIIRARFPEGDDSKTGKRLVSHAIVALNGRVDLGIPASYTGNCVFHCYTGVPMSQVSSRTTPLDDLALRIRQSINETRDRPLLERVVGLAATIPDVSTVKYGNDNLGTDVYTTSWAALPFYKLNFGALGRLEYLRIPDRHFETLCCILPSRNGIWEVAVSMKQADLEQLVRDDEFLAKAKVV